MAKDRGEFAVNEKVLCFHGPLIYEGKVLKAEKKDKEWHYFIHYAGWSKSWDEYVPESRVLKYNEENLLKQKEHKIALNSGKSGKKTSSGPKSETPKGGKRVGSSLAGESTTSSGNVSASESHPPSPAPEEKPDKQKPEKEKPEKEKPEKEKPEKEKPEKEKPEKEKPEKEKPEKEKPEKEKPEKEKLEKEKPEKEKHVKSKDKARAPTSPTPSAVSSTIHDSAKRRKLNTETVESVIIPEGAGSTPEEKHVAKLEVEITMPERLKTFLVDDWDAVSRQKKLFNIPARKSVNTILNEFLESRGQADPGAREFVDGIREYFNSMLGSQLLYRFERQQYGDFLRKDKEDRTPQQIAAEPLQLSAVYGCPHLLRLITSLGRCLSFTTIEQDCIEIFKQYIIHFLDYVSLNFEDHLSMQDYGMSSPEYQRRAPV